MAFDAGMIAAITNELNENIIDSKVEKVQQPEKDQITLVLHSGRETLRLLISAGANAPRIALTSAAQENPISAPMFCMLLRKHLGGAKVTSVRQLEFERAIEIAFAAYDELGFPCEKYLIAEIMGKYSNIIFCTKDKKIISALKIIDFSTSQKRQILPGMTYTMPPPQDKRNPLDETHDGFLSLYEAAPSSSPDKFITLNYLGISSLLAREIAFRANTLGDGEKLWSEFDAVMTAIREKHFTPVMVKDKNDAMKPVEYCFYPIRQYGPDYECTEMPSFGALIDGFFSERDRTDRIKQRAGDIFNLLTHAENRLIKKTELQKQDIKECEQKDKFKLYGDLITSNLYRIGRGMKDVSLTDYYSDPPREVMLELDTRLTPSQNAQRYYKRYNKAKKTETELAHQIEISTAELEYIGTVFDSLTRAENENDLAEIRRELYESGYASRMKSYTAAKIKPAKPIELHTSGGYRLLVGKNNSQNDYVTTKAAGKNDYWFHVKNVPGSHVIMFTDSNPDREGEEPTERDFTEAATVAAYYSKAKTGENVAVDYTLIRNVKKPAGSKPGFVIFTKNWTAYVTPDENLVKTLK
ncbi:MAG: NFACT RNA binding domain-containing protein [Eubacteriales bacterium]